MHVYLVQHGDTLTEIAHRYRVMPDLLAVCNDLRNPACLLPGQSLSIPSRLDPDGTDGYSTYLVQEGDTPRSLSERWQLPLSWLAFCNQWRDGRLLHPGDVILVPRLQDESETRSVHEPTPLGLMSLEPLCTRAGEQAPLTYLGVQGLRIDAMGNAHLPPSAGWQTERALLICTLAGSSNILPDVAKAILKSDLAQSRLLDGLGARLQEAGAAGVIFDWGTLGTRSEVAYLDLVREAGRRLRPMGLIVALRLPSNSPLMRRSSALQRTVQAIDHVFYEPVPLPPARGKRDASAVAPAPLTGVDDVRHALLKAGKLIPLQKIWLVLHPVGMLAVRDALQRVSPYQARCWAEQIGATLVRDEVSGLLRFRCLSGEGVGTVWLEDLWSLVRKLDLLNQMQVQGLALWEAGGYFPEAWNWLHDQLQQEPEEWK